MISSMHCTKPRLFACETMAENSFFPDCDSPARLSLGSQISLSVCAKNRIGRCSDFPLWKGAEFFVTLTCARETLNGNTFLVAYFS